MNRWLIVSLIALLPASQVSAQTADEFFETKIRPVLIGTCFQCHGGEKTSSGLRLDRRQHLMSGGERGPAIVPGDAENSLLIHTIRRTHADLSMPPKKPLRESVVTDFQHWIDAGANWPASIAEPAANQGRHWAFRPIGQFDVPQTDAASSAHPIDRFIDARRKELGLTPVAQADRRTLIRRASFDLTGLPPHWQRTQEFIADDRTPSIELRDLHSLRRCVSARDYRNFFTCCFAR